jgi:hypothetical protein
MKWAYDEGLTEEVGQLYHHGYDTIMTEWVIQVAIEIWNQNRTPFVRNYFDS